MTSPATSLLQRYRRQGNPLLLGQLYDQIAPELLTLALHLTHSPTQAEDLVQEVFLQAIQDQADWNPDMPVESWLRHLLAHLFDADNPGGPTSTSLAEVNEKRELEDHHSPVGDAEFAELQEQLRRAIDCLPEQYQIVVRLLVFEGMNSGQVGEALHRPAGTVRSQLSRGLDRLRKLLPGALGLAIWGVGEGTGHAAPLHAMRQRFLDRVPPLRSPADELRRLLQSEIRNCYGIDPVWTRTNAEGRFTLPSRVRPGSLVLPARPQRPRRRPRALVPSKTRRGET